MTPTLKVAETELAEPTASEAIAERILITAMMVNPLVFLDPTQLLAAAGRVGARALLEPRLLVRVVRDVGRELTEVALGRSQRAPEPGDKRWTDPAFAKSPVFHRLMQGYLACRSGVQRVVNEVLGTRIDLGKITADVYAVGALSDHIMPWDACYRTPQLFGGPKLFVASSSGHIQALVNRRPPPGRATTRTTLSGPTPRPGSPPPARRRAPGGRTGPSGKGRAPAPSGTRRRRWGARPIRRSWRRPAATSTRRPSR